MLLLAFFLAPFESLLFYPVTTFAGTGFAVLRAYPEAVRIVVGGSAADAVTLEDFLLGNVSLPWSG